MQDLLLSPLLTRLHYINAQHKAVILVLINLLALLGFSAHKTSGQSALALYRQAEKLYDLDVTTEYTDSLALHKYLAAARIMSEAGTRNSILIDCYLKAGNIKLTYQFHDAARKFYYHSIDWNTPNIDSVLLYQSYLYLGSSWYLQNVVDSAKFYFEASSTLAEKLERKNLPDMYRLYNSLGAIYFQSGNYNQARNYFQIALGFVSPTDQSYNYVYSSILSNIATCELERKNFPEAAALYKEVIKKGRQLDVAYQSLANTYFKWGKTDSALVVLSANELDDGIYKVRAYNLKGKIYETNSNWQAAEKFYDSSLLINKKLFGKLINKERGLSYQNKAILARSRGLLNEALYWCNRSLEELHLNFKAKTIKDLPPVTQNSVSPITTFEVILLKAQIFYDKYQKSHVQEDLFSSVLTYKAAFSQGNYIKRTFDNDEARSFFNTSYVNLYSQAIRATTEAAVKDSKNLDMLVFLLENYKGSILAHNLSLQQLKASSGISEKDLQHEKNLKDLIALYANRINNTETSATDEPMRKRYVELQVELSRLQQKFDENSSLNYFRYQQTPNDLQISSVQQQLDNNTAILNYYFDGKDFYCLAISNDKQQLHKTPLTESLKRDLKKLHLSLRDQTEGRRYDGIKSSYAVYRELLYPLKPVWANKDKLIILPDGPLNVIPFEALSTHPKNPDYLVWDKTISYHYSYTLWKNTAAPIKINFANSIGFAPFAPTSGLSIQTELPVLSNSARELQSLNGLVAIGPNARKSYFRQNSINRSILHLATHAFMSDSLKNNGWIEFYPSATAPDSNKLFVNEIYNLNLNSAALVILSACETASGYNEGGEGLLSLSRAFLYAGARSVISTLWKTEDKASAFLITRFYHHLREGESKELSLKKAKCDLMTNSDISPVYKSPNYWSGFILIGNTTNQPQSVDSWIGYNWTIALFILILIGSAVYLSRGRIRNGFSLKQKMQEQ